MPLIPAFRRQKKEDVYEFKTNLVNITSSRTPKAMLTISKIQK